MPCADEKLVQDFYYFWKWEYSRRNSEYKERYNVAISCFDDMRSENVCSGSDHFSIGDYHLNLELGVRPSSFICSEFYRSSEKIILDILNNKFTYKYPACISLPTDIGISFLFEELHEELVNSPYIPLEMQDVLSLWPKEDIRIAAINFSKPLDRIIDDIKKLYIMKEYCESWLDHSKINPDLMIPSKKTGEISRLPKRADRDLPRAVGLWLWDYVDTHGVKWENRAKSYAAFQLKFQNPKHPDCFIDKYNANAQLADLLDKTRQCIEEIKVIPMG